MKATETWTAHDKTGVEWNGYSDGTISTINGARGVRCRGSVAAMRACAMTREFIPSAASSDEVEAFFKKALRSTKG